MMQDLRTIAQAIVDGQLPAQAYEDAQYAIVRFPDARRLVVIGLSESDGAGLDGSTVLMDGRKVFTGPLSVTNASAIMKRFPYTAPVSHRGHPFTLGLGDRLGEASRGHIRSLRGRGTFPVLAQQSMRELNLTGRTYEEVLAAAAFAVFEEQYKDGYGADGDHLKKPEEIQYALKCGYTMITLDCSEHIDNTVSGLDDAQVAQRYDALPQEVRRHYEEKFLDLAVPVADGPSIEAKTLARIVLTYHDAIEYTLHVYHDCIAPSPNPIDFEMSIDETATPTDPAAHYVVARELLDGHVDVVSLAPRFCGEFQKGIDYIGDPDRFSAEFELHARIAELLGYKISVHSGSDKFTIFPAVGRQTYGRVHVKTAGTSWLEALRVIARRDPSLYREIHAFALDNVEEAKKYYHIGTANDTIPPLSSVPDDALSGYLDRADSRQALHITYGLILQARTPDGGLRFRNRFFACLYDNDEEYAQTLEKHIGKHLDALGK
ncbi:MAG TPA: tagaturonate epimerase family protein [Clostridia bacterium]